MTTNVDRIRDLLDHNDLSKLATDVGRCVDTKNFDKMSTIFTTDAVLTTPDGTSTGVEAIIGTARLTMQRSKSLSISSRALRSNFTAMTLRWTPTLSRSSFLSPPHPRTIE